MSSGNNQWGSKLIQQTLATIPISPNSSLKYLTKDSPFYSRSEVCHFNSNFRKGFRRHRIEDNDVEVICQQQLKRIFDGIKETVSSEEEQLQPGGLSPMTKTRLSQCNNYPETAIVAIFVYFKDEIKIGTGVVVGPHVILTCSHLFQPDKIEKQIRVIPWSRLTQLLKYNNENQFKAFLQKQSIKAIGVNPQSSPQLQQQENHYNPNSKKQNRTSDYRVIEVGPEYNLELMCQSLSYAMGYQNKSNEIANQKTRIYGSTVIGQKIKTIQTSLFEGLQKIYGNSIYYKGKFSGGMSGGPIIIELKGNFIVVGIHTNGQQQPEKEGLNNGILLTTKIFDNLKQMKFPVHHYNFGQQEQLIKQIQNLKNIIDEVSVHKLIFGRQQRMTLSLGRISTILEKNKNFGPQGALSLANALRDPQNEHLQGRIIQLNLAKCRLYSIGCDHLQKLHLPILRKLNISGNHIGHDGLRIITKVLSHSKGLKVLEIANNEIEDDGFEEVCNGNWIHLQELNIRKNQIKSLEPLSKTDRWQSLSTLRIGKNPQLKLQKSIVQGRRWRLRYLDIVQRDSEESLNDFREIFGYEVLPISTEQQSQEYQLTSISSNNNAASSLFYPQLMLAEEGATITRSTGAQDNHHGMEGIALPPIKSRSSEN